MSADPATVVTGIRHGNAGRSTPACRITLHGLPGGQVRAVCEPCGDWARTFEAGHDVEDFVRLEVMHGVGAEVA